MLCLQDQRENIHGDEPGRSSVTSALEKMYGCHVVASAFVKNGTKVKHIPDNSEEPDDITLTDHAVKL